MYKRIFLDNGFKNLVGSDSSFLGYESPAGQALEQWFRKNRLLPAIQIVVSYEAVRVLGSDDKTHCLVWHGEGIAVGVYDWGRGYSEKGYLVFGSMVLDNGSEETEHRIPLLDQVLVESSI